MNNERDSKIEKEKINEIRLIVEVIEQNFGRLSIYKDPMTKKCIFLEKLLIISDIFKGLLIREAIEIPDDLVTKINKIHVIMNDNIASLIETIQQPCYSPDHPYGKELMNTAQYDFDNKK
jgi:hypothetical protein